MWSYEGPLTSIAASRKKVGEALVVAVPAAVPLAVFERSALATGRTRSCRREPRDADSIGEDGPSQMAFEDLAMYRAEPNYTVFYPSDAVSAERLLALMAYHPGPAYIRTSRPKTPVIYGNDEPFTIGGLKVLRESAADVATVIGAGITVFEALKAYDQLKAGGTAIRVIDL